MSYLFPIPKINVISPKKIDTTKLIRGTLYLASKQTSKNVLKAISEAEKQSLISKL